MTKNFNLGHQTFFSKTWLYRSLDIMISYHRVQYQKKLIVQSWEDLVTDGQADRQTDENDFIGRCPTNVDYPTNNLRILVGLFGSIAFQGLRDNIKFLSSILSVELRKKELILIEGRKSWKLFLECLIEDWVSGATLTKYLVKALAISCDSVTLWPLPKILNGATFGNSFKDIRLFIPFHIRVKSFRLFWKQFVK